MKHQKECITENLKNMSYKYFPKEFSSYKDYVKYLKEKGLAIEVPENNPYKIRVMKTYTDLNQSKKLAEILPLESADMYYFTIIRNYPYSQGKIKVITKIMDGSFSSDYDIPCWSLAALLDVIPEVSLNTFKDGKWNAMVQHDDKMIYEDKDNPVDACYEMIIKLYEQKLL